MALNTTTLSSAVAVSDNSIVVASATGAAVGSLVLIDQEVMVIGKSYVSGTTIPVYRGQNGSVTAAHASSANVVFFLGTDEVAQSPQTLTQWPIAGRGRPLVSYSAAGAIALPTPGTDQVAVINGTSALAMTLAVPTTDMDGTILYIVGNGKAAHTVTATGGLGAGGTALDTLTFAAGGQQCVAVIAANAVWVPLPSVLAGTLTNITVTAS